MPWKGTAAEMLEREFLEIRHRLLDIAAAMDRIDRCARNDEVRSNPGMLQLSAAAGLLVDGKPERAERVQMIFSDPYDEGWRSND